MIDGRPTESQLLKPKMLQMNHGSQSNNSAAAANVKMPVFACAPSLHWEHCAQLDFGCPECVPWKAEFKILHKTYFSVGFSHWSRWPNQS